MKDHQRAEFTNKLRSTAIKYQGTQQLRSRLAAVVDEYIPKDKNIETELDALQAEIDQLKNPWKPNEVLESYTHESDNLVQGVILFKSGDELRVSTSKNVFDALTENLGLVAKNSFSAIEKLGR